MGLSSYELFEFKKIFKLMMFRLMKKMFRLMYLRS